MPSNPSQEVGAPIPNNTAHAISVTLPTWAANVGYEEGEEWVTSKMKSGYPRFFIHEIIQGLAKAIESKYGRDGERCMIFPSYNTAKRCREFIKQRSEAENTTVRILRLRTPAPSTEFEKSTVVEAEIGIVFFPASEFGVAKQYWQHSGEGISSRMAEYVMKELFEKEKKDQARLKSRNKQELQAQSIQKKSPSISASIRSNSMNQNEDADKEFNLFIEQKYGRVLDLKFADEAKSALRRRICGKADKSSNQEEEMEKARRGKFLSEADVFLYPTGMAAIFNAYQAVLAVDKKPRKAVCFGFPYVDTLNILKKFGPGVHFLGLGDDESLDELEKDLESGEKEISSLFCECPSNPLLKTPDLPRIKALAEKYNFMVVVDETVGNFLNISVLPHCDIVVSSLTKVFSGDSNVMGGSLILNPLSPHYQELKQYYAENFEDLYWAEDALYLERNSRDFAARSSMINENAAKVLKLLQESPVVGQLYYPSISPTKKHYEAVKTPQGGYGGLMSIVFKEPKQAISFYNTANLYKGPSLGTNFTLASPYAILAHYQELDEIEKWGVDRNLVRISVGIEDPDELLEVFRSSLKVAEEAE